MASVDDSMLQLMHMIATGETDLVAEMLSASPDLAHASLAVGATRQDAATYHLDAIEHYVYAGDTALHVGAAAHRLETVRALLDGGADPDRSNRSGSTPMQLATQTTGRGGSGSPEAKVQQALIVELLTQHATAR
jgi:hypothetical protein